MQTIPRYLTAFDTAQLPADMASVVVIGSGVAGLRAAIAAAEHGDVLLLTKTVLPDSTTSHAQGGIAIAPGGEASRESHVRDTLDVACGLAHPDVVEFMARHAHESFQDLCDWGMRFDRRNGELDYAREGGHSHARILHADGDATGRELARTLIAALRATPNIRVVENCFAVDLLTAGDRCVGALVVDAAGALRTVIAKQTILATGGCGQLFRETTNPPEATGDGVALAFRAGAELQDMEMMQFHPTVLFVNGACRSLISEAVRGAGATLVDAAGRRFMPEYHERAELAPRDVVSRAILAELAKTNSDCVYLDIRGIGGDAFHRRFPQISKSCEHFGIDLDTARIPVRPAAHYMIGGIRVDLDGQSTLEGLLACGEVSSSGIHGANRLASNSLLEGLVFGARSGDVAGRIARAERDAKSLSIVSRATESPPREGIWTALTAEIQETMWDCVGISRDAAGLKYVAAKFGELLGDPMALALDGPEAFEVANLLTTGWLMAQSAERREESRGVHYRVDFPATDDARWRRHIVVRRSERGVEFREVDLPSALCADESQTPIA
ncbi:MAG: L-aspartate oxidase [Phycisphaerales bacterium]|nr:L-aspartate oxidase [Phycisphaerales bacterium]MCB9854396.1 L-aspartate oxidase [Phycisphaerales bacterium]MCB9863597.1 L-aspartate oxidase [Phycisphaerales bacterium]